MKRMALIILAFMGTVKYLDAQQSQQVSRDEVINYNMCRLVQIKKYQPNLIAIQ